MNAEVKDLVSKCPTCQAHQPAQCREELKPYPIPFRPWETVSMDLFELGKQHFQHLQEIGSSSILRQAPVTHNLMAEQRTQSKLAKR